MTVTDLFPPNLSQPPSQPAAGGSIASYGSQSSQLLCRFCNNGPAAQTTFRQHTGMIIVMKFSKIVGPFCRNCGLAAFRSTTAHTLLAGW
jgi:hypothetical protein